METLPFCQCGTYAAGQCIKCLQPLCGYHMERLEAGEFCVEHRDEWFVEDNLRRRAIGAENATAFADFLREAGEWLRKDQRPTTVVSSPDGSSWEGWVYNAPGSGAQERFMLTTASGLLKQEMKTKKVLEASLFRKAKFESFWATAPLPRTLFWPATP